VLGVLFAVLTLAVGASGLGNVDHLDNLNTVVVVDLMRAQPASAI